MSQNGFKWKVRFQAKDYRRVKGDPLGVQKTHVSKSFTLGRNNKICQNRFGLLVQLIFPAIKMDCLVNKKWLFCEKNNFLFSDQVKKMLLGQIGKNGPKTLSRLKLAFSYLIRKSKVIFSLKNLFLFSGYDKKCHI